MAAVSIPRFIQTESSPRELTLFSFLEGRSHLLRSPGRGPCGRRWLESAALRPHYGSHTRSAFIWCRGQRQDLSL